MATHDVQPGQRIWVSVGGVLEAATVVRDDPDNRRLVVRRDSAPTTDYYVSREVAAAGRLPPPPRPVLEIGQRVAFYRDGYCGEGFVERVYHASQEADIRTDNGGVLRVPIRNCATGSPEELRRAVEQSVEQIRRYRSNNVALPVGRDDGNPRVRLTADTERLLAVLLRPVTPAEVAWADCLRAIVAGDRDKRLSAAAALADLVKAELEG